MKSLIVVALSVAVLSNVSSACPFCNQNKELVIGETLVMGNGTVRSWVHLDKDGKADSVGVTFTDTALLGLPTTKPDNGMDGYEYTLKLPKEASILPFDHIAVDYNPVGHIPAPIYTVPHFDFHFYMMSTQERMLIDTAGEGMKKCLKQPAPEFLPKGFIYAPGSEIKYMGAHWVDVNTPELHGKPFTQTFIYGSYDGKVNFLEPMVAMDYLKTKPNATFDVPQASKVQIKGKYWPTKYRIAYNDIRKEYAISMENLVKR